MTRQEVTESTASMTARDQQTEPPATSRTVPATTHHRPALPPSVFEIDPDIEQRVDQTIQQYSLSEDTARRLLRAWCERSPFARKDIPFDTVPLRVVSSAVLMIEQMIHVEKRTVHSTTEAYLGHADVEPEDLEDIWETQRFGKFKKGSMSWERRGSLRILVCHKCAGTGKRACSRCKKGRVPKTCATCRGTGRGQTGPCTDCDGSGKVLVPCKACRGKGFDQCAVCKGSGRSRTYETIKATASVIQRASVISAPPTIEKAWIKAAPAGEAEWFEGDEDVLGPYVDKALPKDARVRVAQYGVRVVPVGWATLFVGKEIKVYFIGTQHEIKKTAPLLDKKKIIANVAVLVPILLGAIYLLTLIL